MDKDKNKQQFNILTIKNNIPYVISEERISNNRNFREGRS